MNLKFVHWKRGSRNGSRSLAMKIPDQKLPPIGNERTWSGSQCAGSGSCNQPPRDILKRVDPSFYKEPF